MKNSSFNVMFEFVCNQLVLLYQCKIKKPSKPTQFKLTLKTTTQKNLIKLKKKNCFDSKNRKLIKKDLKIFFKVS